MNGVDLPSAAPLWKTPHIYIQAGDPKKQGCIKCGLNRDHIVHKIEDVPKERMVSQSYLGPHAMFSKDELRFIRSILPLDRPETKLIMTKLNKAIDSDWNQRADQRADALARGGVIES